LFKIDLNKRAAKISSLLLLLTFIVGQVIIFAHTHSFDRQTVKHYAAQKDKSKVSEDNCPICVQHGNVQLLLQQQLFNFWALSSSYTPVAFTAIYQSIQLLLSGNRGPPAL
jgi:hypothetical protein